MKSSTAKVTLALAIGLITATSAAYAGPAQTHLGSTTPPPYDSTLNDIARAPFHLARETWRVTESVATTVGHSPVIAYQVIRGERPLFPQETASRDSGHREQIALTGHKTPSHYDPPI